PGVRCRLPATEAEQPGHHGEVLATGHRLLDSRVLPGEADHLPDPLGMAGRVDAVDPQRAAVGSDERGQRAHERRLARTVGAEDGDHLATVGDEVEPGEGLHVAEPLGEAVRLDEGGCVGHGTIVRPRTGHPVASSSESWRARLRRPAPVAPSGTATPDDGHRRADQAVGDAGADMTADDMTIAVTRLPEALLSALRKLRDDAAVVSNVPEFTAHLWFEPLPRGGSSPWRWCR